MDLATIETKINSGAYATSEDCDFREGAGVDILKIFNINFIK